MKIDLPRASDEQAKALLKLLAKPPSNVELEMALLGCLLFAPAAIHMLPTGFGADQFGEPVAGRIYQAIRDQVDFGGEPDVVLVWEMLRGDPALTEMGGFQFLMDLVDHAPPAANAPDYAKKIIALSTRREIISTAVKLALSAGERDQGETESSVLIADADAALMALRARDSRDDPVTLADALAGTNAYVDDRSRPVGVKTGIPALDRLLGPMVAGDLIVLGGATGMGKSACGIAIAQNVAGPALAARLNGVDVDPQATNRGVIEFMAEMTFGDAESGGQAVRRHMADVGFHMFGTAFPTYSSIKAKDVSVAQRVMMSEVEIALRDLPIVGVSSKSPLTIDRIKAICIRQFMIWEKLGIEPGLVLIDHMGLVRARKPSTSRTADQTEVAIDAKAMARALGVPVLALVQINRDAAKSDDKRPALHNLKDSGEWENSADAVLLAYRDSYYANREPEPDVEKKVAEWDRWQHRCKSKDLEIFLPKIREGGGGSSAKAWCEIGWNAVRTAEPAGATNMRDLF